MLSIAVGIYCSVVRYDIQRVDYRCLVLERVVCRQRDVLTTRLEELETRSLGK